MRWRTSQSPPRSDRRGGAVRGVLAALLVLAVVAEVGGIGPAARNGIVLAAIAVVAVTASRAPNGGGDLPLPRGRLWTYGLPALLAFGVAATTFSLPFFADDAYWLARSRRATLLDALAPDAGASFYRPIASLAWWSLARVSTTDALAARFLCACLFAIDAALAALVLRRCGIRRGIATGAACAFALNPVGAQTIAWPTNLEALLSAGFCFGALATIPRRARTPRAFVAPVLLGLLAFLAKEDSYVLPFLAVIVGSRLRRSRIGASIRSALPLAVVLALVVAVRAVALRLPAPYVNPYTGRSLFFERALRGPWEALTSECPSSYFLPAPATIANDGAALPWLLSLAPIGWLALGGAAANRRGMRFGVLWLPIALAPIAPLLPIGVDVSCLRWLLLPSLAIGVWVASLAAGSSASARVRWAWLTAWLVASAFVGQRHLDAWRSSARALADAAAAMRPFVQAAPHDARILVYGVPAFVDGALCFTELNGSSLAAGSGRDDVRFFRPESSFGDFDRVLVVRFDSPAADDFARRTPDSTLQPGDSVSLVLQPWSDDASEAVATDLFLRHTYGAGRRIAAFRRTAPVGIAAGRHLTVTTDGNGALADGAPAPAALVMNVVLGGRVERRPFDPKAPFTLPSGAEAAWLEATPLFGSHSMLRGVRIALEP